MTDEEFMTDDDLLPGDEDLLLDDGGVLPDADELATEFEKKGTPRKKRSFLKWLLVLLLLLVAIAAALVGLSRTGYIDLPINRYLPVDKLLKESSKNKIIVEPETKTIQAQLPPAPEMPEEKGKKPAQPNTVGRLYLKLGSCLYKACSKSIADRMAALKLPLVKQKSMQHTTYFELISEISFMKKRAEEKLRLLNRYNETIGFPYLLRTRNNRYIISYGQFPKKTDAIQMKSQLEHLYPQIRLRFRLQPRKDKVAITNLYTGPFSRDKAESIRMKLRDNMDFEWIEIVKLP